MKISGRQSICQFAKFALVGVATNLAGFSLYLALVSFGADPKVTVSILYVVGSLAAFISNRKFTFVDSGNLSATGIRYFGAQLSGYIINLSFLYVFVDLLGFAHQAVQVIAILVVGIWLFWVMRLFVFVHRH
ncbi:GtrA family protein [Synechococcus sp. FGCU-3]|nr:GtrA family protein [Synechococcus sp. FGCU3]